MRTNRNFKGQASVEMALALVFVVLPLTLMLIGLIEIAWTYHALATITRQGARYAANHCWQDSSGSNVVTWMQENSPMFPDRQQLITGGIQVEVAYWRHDPETHTSVAFECGGGCSQECVPDSVTVRLVGYEFSHFITMLGFQPLQMPQFATTVEIQSAGLPLP
jgi:hypothetical protein